MKLSLVDSSGRQRPPVDDDDYIMQARQLMMDLTEISREVANFLFSKLKFTTSSDPYSEMRRLDRQLDRWFANLKPAFRQCPTNSSRIAQFLFFSLQYVKMQEIRLFLLVVLPAHALAVCSLILERSFYIASMLSTFPTSVEPTPAALDPCAATFQTTHDTPASAAPSG